MVNRTEGHCQIRAALRDGTAIILFGVFPVAQVFASRSAVFFLFLAAIITLLSWFVFRPLKPLFQLSRNLENKHRFLLFVTGGLLIWGLFSLVWAPSPKTGAAVISVIVFALIAVIILSGEFKTLVNNRIKIIFVVGLFVGVVFMGVDLRCFGWAYKAFNASHQYFDLNRNTATYALLVWPAIATIEFGTLRSGVLSTALFILTVLVVFSAEGQAAQLGLITSLIIGVLLLLSRLFYRLIIVVMVFGVLIFPLLLPVVSKITEILPAQFVTEGNVAHRLTIWRGYSSLIGERPIAGWGMSAHRYLGKNGMAGKFSKQAGFPEKTTHPHNFILEVWVNLGAIGAVLLAGILLAIGWLGEGLSRKNQIIMTQILTAWYVISLTGHSFTQSWWIATTAIAAVAFATTCTTGDKNFALEK